MSILGKVLGNIAPLLGTVVGGYFGGPQGAALGAKIGGAIGTARGGPTANFAAMPGTGVATLAPIGVGAVAVGGRMAIAGAKAAYRGAIALCRRYPQWCIGVGGTAAISKMIESGQLPAPRPRRRGRGISGRDLRAYRRVHNTLAMFCAPKARIKKVC
jgi:hypothetical protein